MRNLATLIALLASLCAAPAAASAQSQQPRDGVAPRTVTKEDLDEHVHRARDLARQGQFEQALKDYLYVFDNGRQVAGYGGVRLSFVPSEIAQVGAKYPPALQALRERRDEREKLILAGRGGFDELHELTSLNDHLGEPQRNLSLYDQLKKAGAPAEGNRRDLLNLIWERLVEAKRYDELQGVVAGLAKQTAVQIAEYQLNADFPSDDARGGAMYQGYLRTRIASAGGEEYEALLALDKYQMASKLANWMLVFDAGGETYAALIDHAARAGRASVAHELAAQAYKTLKKEQDVALVRAAEARVAK